MHHAVHDPGHRENAPHDGARRRHEVVQRLPLLGDDDLDRRDVERELGRRRRRRGLRDGACFDQGPGERALGHERVGVHGVLVRIEMRRGASAARLDRGQDDSSVVLERRALVLADERLARELVCPVGRQTQGVHRRERLQSARGAGLRPEGELADDVGEVLAGKVERVPGSARHEVQRAGHLLGEDEPRERAARGRGLAGEAPDVLVRGPRRGRKPVGEAQQGLLRPVPPVALVVRVAVRVDLVAARAEDADRGEARDRVLPAELDLGGAVDLGEADAAVSGAGAVGVAGLLGVFLVDRLRDFLLLLFFKFRKKLKIFCEKKWNRKR